MGGHLPQDSSNDLGYTELDVEEVSYEPKNISIASYEPTRKASNTNETPLIFAHGAGGSMLADAVANFRDGFATKQPFICFQGNMNLSSRVRMFNAVLASHAPDDAVLGGRSMGARAAVVCANESEGKYRQLVLVSYPLHTEKKGALEVRDQILLDLAAESEVLFISGEKDSMCDLERLQATRQKMRCKTWIVVVRGANHGMEVKPKSATRDVGVMTGLIAVDWLAQKDSSLANGTIYWDESTTQAEWSGWHEALPQEQAFNLPSSEFAEKEEEVVPAPAKSKKRTSKIASTTDVMEAQSASDVENEQKAVDPKKKRRKHEHDHATGTRVTRSQTNAMQQEH